ncbi:hypothetical protein PR202_gb05156 [Eleusine coracana subsp. coracana]|uniref:RING-CH-type domain-containing protein n=1 Tax=Eleusine coracana subsp. coracana TaxID=191504 RepID=A0AAV5E4Q2_ELECO|nr:hypothetical protein PR202_gb05156 [Eleusine coracana subsp. coracana]
MADHFALMTGRLLTEATLRSAINEAVDVPSTTAGCDQLDLFSDVHLDMGKAKSGVMVECRICQEEGDEAYMETPCSCKGSLKASFLLCFFIGAGPTKLLILFSVFEFDGSCGTFFSLCVRCC